MVVTDPGSSDCQKPGCTNDREETYRGPNDNTLRLCEKHYYNLVSQTSAPRHRIDLGDGIVGTGDTITPPGTSNFSPDIDDATQPELW